MRRDRNLSNLMKCPFHLKHYNNATRKTSERSFKDNQPHQVSFSLMVKDGKFVYVGDEEGLSDYEGEAVDFDGKFIMPGIKEAVIKGLAENVK